MKKAIAILLVLLVAGVMFGADQSLNVSSSVGLNETFLLSTADITDFTATEAVETLALGSSSSGTFYMGLRTNKKTVTYVKISGSALVTGTSGDNAIGYTISTTTDDDWTKVVDLTVPKTATLAAKTGATIGTFAGGVGMRGMTAPATITLNATDLGLAPAATYSATLTIEVGTP